MRREYLISFLLLFMLLVPVSSAFAEEEEEPVQTMPVPDEVTTVIHEGDGAQLPAVQDKAARLSLRQRALQRRAALRKAKTRRSSATQGRKVLATKRQSLLVARQRKLVVLQKQLKLAQRKRNRLQISRLQKAIVRQKALIAKAQYGGEQAAGGQSTTFPPRGAGGGVGHGLIQSGGTVLTGPMAPGGLVGANPTPHP